MYEGAHFVPSTSSEIVCRTRTKVRESDDSLLRLRSWLSDSTEEVKSLSFLVLEGQQGQGWVRKFRVKFSGGGGSSGRTSRPRSDDVEGRRFTETVVNVLGR